MHGILEYTQAEHYHSRPRARARVRGRARPRGRVGVRDRSRPSARAGVLLPFSLPSPFPPFPS